MSRYRPTQTTGRAVPSLGMHKPERKPSISGFLDQSGDDFARIAHFARSSMAPRRLTAGPNVTYRFLIDRRTGPARDVKELLFARAPSVNSCRSEPRASFLLTSRTDIRATQRLSGLHQPDFAWEATRAGIKYDHRNRRQGEESGSRVCRD
jgi:hypothetical protein